MAVKIEYEVESDESELILTEDETDNIINNLKDELILESIIQQIKHPFDNSYGNTDYLNIFETRYNYLIDVYKDSTTFISKISYVREVMYSEIFNTIIKKFNLSYTDNGLDVVEYTKYLYNFFCLDYKDDLINYFVNTILKNEKSIASSLSDPMYSKTLSANALKKVLKSRNEAVIIANITEVIKNIVQSDMDNLVIIKSICDDDIADATKFYINKFFLVDFSISPSKDFKNIYFSIILNKEQGYNDIINQVKMNLYNIVPKKNK